MGTQEQALFLINNTRQREADPGNLSQFHTLFLYKVRYCPHQKIIILCTVLVGTPDPLGSHDLFFRIYHHHGNMIVRNINPGGISRTTAD